MSEFSLEPPSFGLIDINQEEFSNSLFDSILDDWLPPNDMSVPIQTDLDTSVSRSGSIDISTTNSNLTFYDLNTDSIVLNNSAAESIIQSEFPTSSDGTVSNFDDSVEDAYSVDLNGHSPDSLSTSNAQQYLNFDAPVIDQYRTSTPIPVTSEQIISRSQGPIQVILPSLTVVNIIVQTAEIQGGEENIRGQGKEQETMEQPTYAQFVNQLNEAPTTSTSDRTSENVEQDLDEQQQQQENQNYRNSEKIFSRELQKHTKRVDKLKGKHPIILKLCTNCPNNCDGKFNETERRIIWDAYWNLDYTAQRKWLNSYVEVVPIKRRRVSKSANDSRKKESRKYVLPKKDGKEKVCLSFFLKTLGYTSDSVIIELRKANKRGPLQSHVKENRGRKKDTKSCNYTLIRNHINSHNPHKASNNSYVGLPLKDLYTDFASKHPGVCSKETYRKVMVELRGSS